MATDITSGLWRYLRQVGSILGIVALSVMTTLLVQHLISPPHAAAQSSPQEIRASDMVVVNQDGTVVGRLGAGPAGYGRLDLFDKAGKARMSLNSAGYIVVFGPDGTTKRFVAGYDPDPGSMGEPPLNGVWLDGNGTVANWLPDFSQPSSVQSPP